MGLGRQISWHWFCVTSPTASWSGPPGTLPVLQIVSLPLYSASKQMNVNLVLRMNMFHLFFHARKIRTLELVIYPLLFIKKSDQRCPHAFNFLCISNCNASLLILYMKKIKVIFLCCRNKGNCYNGV